MDFLVNNIEKIHSMNFKKVTPEKTSVKKETVSKKSSKSDNDKLDISTNVKQFQDKVKESQEYMEKLKQTKTLDEEKIKEFQKNVKNREYNLEKIDNKIVYSLMTLPAFQRINFSGSSNQSEEIGSVDQKNVKAELEELKKIEEELSNGEKMDKILEEALSYLMKSLLSG